MPFDAARPAFEARREPPGAVGARGRRPSSGPERPRRPGPPALAARLFDDGPPAAGGAARAAGGGGRAPAGCCARRSTRPSPRSTAGSRPREVALVVPRLAEVRDDLERLLDDWGVPARLTSRVRALEAPLALALTHLLRLGELAPDAPGALDHLLGWLRTPYSGADPAQVDLFEAGARRGGIATRGELMGRWEGAGHRPRAAPRRGRPPGPASPARGDGRRRLAGAAAGGRRRRPPGARRPARPGRAGGPRGASPRPSPTTRGDAARTTTAPARPRGPLPPGVVGELIADLTFVAREEAPGGLDVHDLASLRGSRYEVVVIAGLDGDGTPARPAADPLLAGLREGLADVLPARAPGTSESRLRFVHAADAARSRLVLVRRAVDDEGRELAPSPYWLEACRVAGRHFDELDRAPGARGRGARLGGRRAQRAGRPAGDGPRRRGRAGAPGGGGGAAGAPRRARPRTPSATARGCA